MKRVIHALLLAGLFAGATSGCQSLGSKTFRGQSPVAGQAEDGQTVTPAGHYHTPVRSAMSDIRDHHQQHHNTSVEYYPQTGPRFGHGGAEYCPPQGYDNCPPGGRPSHDRMTYGYRVPNDLVYPDANSVGGAVMYPYYTHKGPSDFFRK